MDAYLESLEWSARFAPHLQEQSDEKPRAPAKR
jgi:hypothetical protein